MGGARAAPGVMMHSTTETAAAPPPENAPVVDGKAAAQSTVPSDSPQNAQDKDGAEYVEGYKLAIVVASVALSCFLMLLDTMIISTVSRISTAIFNRLTIQAIPRITDTFSSLPDVGWYASAYQFGRCRQLSQCTPKYMADIQSAAPQPLTGRIYTHFNTKWTFLAFFAIFELGSVLCGAAASSAMLIVGRAVAGFGAAGIIIGAITIISSCVPLEKRPGLLGITMGFNQLGLVAGPLIGGAFTSYSSWRWCFYVNLPAGAVAVVAIALLRIPEQTKKASAMSILPRLHRYLDLVGFVLFAAAVLQLLLALQYGGNEYAWNDSRVIGLFCGAAATGVVWFFWNRHNGDDGLLPHYMIRQTAVWASGVYQACLMSAVYGAIHFLPIYFQSINNATPIMSGVYLLPIILPQLVMAASSGAISKSSANPQVHVLTVAVSKTGYVIPLALFSTVLLSVASGLYTTLRPSTPKGAILVVQAVVSGQELSSAMAWMVFAQSLAPAIVLALCNVIFSASLKSQLAHHAPHANAADIVHAGATGFRAIVDPGDLPGILVAYANSIDRVFYLVAAMAALGGVFVWGMGWNDIRKGGTDIENTNLAMAASTPTVGDLFAIEIPITNLERSQQFYAELFAWEFAGALPKATENIKSLHFFTNTSKTIKGALLLLEEGHSPTASGKEGWGVYPTFHVADVGKAIDKAESLGGQVKTPRTVIPNGMGVAGHLIDPDNNVIGIWSQN
uniref:Putative HC-toxin efflux carrier TOXA n=1 Tax=Tolypocladium ophioglossoides (strain CBS 100239) TaxID=1163406 RepID=A0A0L0N955_TOLOC